MKSPIYIIEHLEPEIWPWCLIEYEHISETVGKENLWFTNISEKDIQKLEKFGKVFTQSVKNMPLENVCVLDPAAKETLSPENSKSFDYFIFGGILGDDPPKQRTTPELTQFLPDAIPMNIGEKQMSTDNAVCVTKEIVSGKPLSSLKFQDSIEIELNEIESVQLPYRYLLINNKPFMSPKIKEYLASKEEF